ncbi:hypothetical protein E0Z10_g2177 [Xylaria hypoxylon]|uniref:Rhodopsin domain-containing protein n=1 Tax=Xylaria hypoxylon TaxID=37992 RepID=A0A4Z0Z319_9PEZI|nr:hypothetical protein E0Z10_g2177 [Xylaria hypoxylon]
MPSTDHSQVDIGTIITGSILGFFTTIIVILRFWARRLTRQRFGLDDYLCLAALLFHHVLLAASGVASVDGGLGRNMMVTAAEDPNSTVILFQAIFVAEIAYTYSSPVIKLSVLAFYWRIFPTPAVRLGCKVLGSACLAWCIAITILNFTQCRPLKAFWYIELQLLATTHCLNPILCSLGNSIANSVIDFSTLVLPIREIAKLNIKTRQKINIGIVFLLGGIAFAASLVRTIATGVVYKKGINNSTNEYILAGLATVVEIYVSIIGACLPTLMPVYYQLRYGAMPTSSASDHSQGKRSATAAIPARRLAHQRHVSTNNDSLERLTENEHGFALVAHHGTHDFKISGSPRSNDFV